MFSLAAFAITATTKAVLSQIAMAAAIAAATTTAVRVVDKVFD